MTLIFVLMATSRIKCCLPIDGEIPGLHFLAELLAMIQIPPPRAGRQGMPVLGDMGKPTMRGIRLKKAPDLTTMIFLAGNVPNVERTMAREV